MGYIRHHAIVVTGTYDKFIDDAHMAARGIFPWVSPICPTRVNGTRSFFIPPDGSKEGWKESDDGDSERAAFLEYLDKIRHADNSSPLSWAEVMYGDDDGKSYVIRHDNDIPVIGE